MQRVVSRKSSTPSSLFLSLSLHTSSYLLRCFHPFSHILPSTASIQILKFCRHSNNCRLRKLPQKISLYACYLLPTLRRLSLVMLFRENQRYWESANEFREMNKWTDKRQAANRQTQWLTDRCILSELSRKYKEIPNAKKEWTGIMMGRTIAMVTEKRVSVKAG